MVYHDINPSEDDYRNIFQEMANNNAIDIQNNIFKQDSFSKAFRYIMTS
jgi:hypothetical protein